MPESLVATFGPIPRRSSRTGSTPESVIRDEQTSGRQHQRSLEPPEASIVQHGTEEADQERSLPFPLHSGDGDSPNQVSSADFNPNPVHASSWDPSGVHLQSATGGNAGNTAGHSDIGPHQFGVPVSAAPAHQPMRGITEVGGTSILSVGTAAQIRGQRNRFILELNDLIDSDTNAWKENRLIVQAILRDEVRKARGDPAQANTGQDPHSPDRNNY
jgi:hypothetical protein